MRTASRRSYGGPSVIHRADRPVPQIASDQMLVKVAYSTVNRTDLGFLRGRPLITRVFAGLLRPRCPALGCEYSGVVTEVGGDTGDFAVGDRVFGYDDSANGFGGHAEYKAVRSTGMVTIIPEGVSFASAAASTEGAATSPTEHLETVAAFGAAQLIDWRTQPPDSLSRHCDYFFDAVGKSSFAVARRVLKPGGTYTSSDLGAGGQNLWLSIINPLQRLITKRSVRFPIPAKSAKLLAEIRRRLGTGEFQPLLDRAYPLRETAEAFEYVQAGNKLGNVLITVDPTAGASPAA